MEKNNVDNTKKLQLLSFCTGYGGIERGLQLAGVQFKTIAHVEIEAFAIANLVAKMENNELVPAPIWTNVKTLPLEVFRERVDILTGGYPCQPFSAAGQRKGQEDPRHLWPFIIKAIDVIRPNTVFFENVEGHVSLGLQNVIESLEIRGYKTTWGIFSAEEVGLPHRRKRVFILGMANNDSQVRGRSSSEQQVEIEVKEATRGSSVGDSGDERTPELGNTKHDGSSTKWYKQELQRGKNCQKGEVEQFERSIELEYPTSIGAQSKQGKKKRQEREPNMAYNANIPARPGKPQHNWEEPRTIKPQLGGATNGTTSRVDRLRLLGNGVVPQTAALAWKILNQKLNNK